jgi:transposase-like protein
MEPTMEAGVEPAGEARPPLGPVVKIDEGRIQAHLDEVVRATVEETLNALLDAEADHLCGARKYERTEGRQDTRAGSYDRRRESSVEEALIEMYLAGVSVRRVEDITQALWGTRVSASTVSGLNQKIYGKINEWRERPLVGDFPYVFLDGIWLKRSWGGEVKNVSVLVAIGVAQSGYREILAVSEGAKEDTASWTTFLRELKERGLRGVELFVSDKCLGLVENLADFYPNALWQRCVVHFYRNVWTAVPTGKVKEVAAMLKAIHAQEDAKAAKEKALQVVEKLRAMRLAKAAVIVENGIDETLSYYNMPPEHWRCLRTNNPLERLMREIRRRTRVVGAFPDGQSALMLVAARLRHVAATKWGTKRYLQMDRLAEVVAIA